jgi:DNA-binding beta-propeller fold protein YncE
MFIPIPAIGYGTAPTHDGAWLLVALRETKQVAVIDLRGMRTVKTIDVPDGPTEILVSPDGRMAYVSCTRAKQVAAIDLSLWKVTRLIDAGEGDDGLAWAR